MINIEELKKQRGDDYYLLQLITDIDYANDRGRLPLSSSIREFREVFGVVPGDEKLVIVGSKIILDMKTMNVLDYVEGDETKHVVPTSLLHKRAGSDVINAIKSFLENKKYFINGKII